MLNAMSINSIIAIVVDAVLVLLVLIFFLVGIKKGFVKMCKGFVASVLVLVIAGVTTAPLSKFIISKTTWDESLATTITAPLVDKIPNPYAEIYYTDLDANPETEDELVFDAGNGEKPYEEIFNDSMLGKLGLAKIMKPLVTRAITEDTPKVFLIDALGQSIVYIIYLVAGFIIIAILARIIISLLFLAFKKLLTNLYILYFLDKVLGAVFGLATGAFTILCVLAIFQLMQNLAFMESVNTVLSQTYIAKFVMDYNFIYTFISSNLNIGNLLGK